MKPKERFLKDQEILQFLNELDDEEDENEIEDSSSDDSGRSEPEVPSPKRRKLSKVCKRNAAAADEKYYSDGSEPEVPSPKRHKLSEVGNRSGAAADNLEAPVLNSDGIFETASNNPETVDISLDEIPNFNPQALNGSNCFYLIPVEDLECIEMPEEEHIESSNVNISELPTLETSELSITNIVQPSPSITNTVQPATTSTVQPATTNTVQPSTSKLPPKPRKKIKVSKPKKQQNTAKKNIKKPTKPRRIWRKCPIPVRSIKLYKFNYQGPSGPNPNLVTPEIKSQFDFYSLFLTDELLDKIVEETNRYAYQCTIHRISLENIKENSRLATWVDTTREEIRNFIGIILWMGLDQKPTLAHYWSSSTIYYGKTSDYMSRNRFELLLSYIHFTDNETANTDDKMYKLRFILDYLNDRFSKMFIPGPDICIDETMMAFKGRLSFRQYIPNKRHKWGVKFFKLCLPHGYTYKFKIYCGNENDRDEETSLSEDVVIKLCEGILDQKRTVYVDNFYTSVSLAEHLLSRKTHLVGTLCSNRVDNPKFVKKAKLKKGEMVSRMSRRIIVSKWKDKRDVMFLSTKHRPGFRLVRSKRFNKVSLKPSAVADYNDAKTFIDISDQMKSYGSPTRRGVKWFRKVFVELMCNAAVVNAYILYIAKNKPKRLTITEFREKLVYGLLQAKTKTKMPLVSPNSVRHKLQMVEGNGSRNRGRCTTCYKKVSARQGRNVAVKLPWTHFTCSGCTEKYTCLQCFNSLHYTKRL